MRTRSLLLIIGLFSANLSRAQDIGTVTLLRENSLRLIRGTAVLHGVESMHLRQGDVLETGSNATVQAQLELTNGAVLELGPGTKLYLFGEGEIVLLAGWLKGETTGGHFRYVNPRMSAATEGANVVLHAYEDTVDVFVERGSASVTFDKGASLRSSAQANFFTGRNGSATGRPSAEFIAGMPLSFRDVIPSRLSRFAGKQAAEPERDHAVTYQDVERLLTLPPSLRKGLVSRFRPRLDDRAFRDAIEAHLRSLPEWRAALHPEDAQSGTAHR